MLLQLFINGIITGCTYALMALGFSLIYITTRIFHFAHGAIYTLSAYLFFTFYNIAKLPLFISILLSLLITALFGIGIDKFVYYPLNKKNSSSLILMLSAIGLYTIIVNFIAMIYGNETKVLMPGIQPTYQFRSIILTQIQVITLITSIIIFAFVIIFLRITNLGITIRAMRDNPVLLSALGINIRRVRLFVFSFGSMLAAIASVLNGLDVGIDPNIGMSIFLNAAVGVIIGGVATFEAPVLGSLLLSSVQSLVIWRASARWQDTITFIILILFLLFKPQGILGLRTRIEEVEA